MRSKPARETRASPRADSLQFGRLGTRRPVGHGFIDRTYVGAAVLAVVLTVAAIVAPKVTLPLIATALGLAWASARASRLIFVVITCGMTALPSFVPSSLYLHGFQFFVFEPALLIGAVALRKSVDRRVSVPICALGAVYFLDVLVGLVKGYPVDAVGVDPRGILDMMLAYLLAAYAYDEALRGPILRFIKYVLWWSLALTAAAAAGALTLSGRSEPDALFINGVSVGTSTIRVLAASTDLSVAVACACLSLFTFSRVSARHIAAFFIPAIGIVELSASRNSILALGGALLLILVYRRSNGWILILRITVILGTAAVCYASATEFFDLPGGFVNSQVAGYESRVINGLRPSVRSSDSSTQEREIEDQYLEVAIGSSPLVGHGFGYSYKPAYGPTGGFYATKGTFYAENFYLWTLAKEGAIGLIAFAYFAGLPLLRIKTLEPDQVALGAAIAGMLTASVVAPVPLGQGSIVLGSALGILVTLQAQQRRRSQDGSPPLVAPRTIVLRPVGASTE